MNGRSTIELNRNTKVLCSVTALGLVAACTWLAAGAENTAQSDGEGVPIEIRAQRFVVVDDGGKERAVLGILEHGEVGLTVWNEQKTGAISVTINRKGPRISFENAKGVELLSLGIMIDKQPLLIMKDEKGTRRVVITAVPGGEVHIGLYDAKQKNRCKIALTESGEPQIYLKDDQERGRGTFMMTEGIVALDLWDRKGQARVVFQINAENFADAAVYGADGELIWSAGTP